ncbi:hypothetical protein SORBI_3010G032800 [Sorghum bicolor]|uniref:Uncharacterized protein n=1 Tax=Sorghum bicolor TaxID=4558 RepID=A0A1W0VRC4_SORBI|nr:hypothetical protein SORBI_3010G032800 [Sorghum bicolor]
MADDTSTSSGSCIRIYGPENFKDNFRIFKKEDEIRPVLAKIERIHDEVKLDNGLCFGLFDPATNILVNSVISNSEGAPPPPPLPPPRRAYAGRRRRRGWEEEDNGSRARAYMAQRSFDGLIAFLTCLFPYLPDAEALAYLDAAELDPLVAALVIISRRGIQDEFDLCSPITEAAAEVALRCSAAAAKHPDPRWFVQAWKKVLSPAVEALGDPAAPPSRETLGDAVRRALDAAAPDVLQLKGSWDLAKGRLAAASSKIYAAPPSKELPPVRAAMKRMLLATIHGLYVQALGRLPTAELRSRYHRSLLLGGYCYGPLDPVSNIIVNTIWYEQNFPTGKQFSVSMVSTQMLWRVAARSLYGLISFLCTRRQGLTPDEAVQCLLMTRADLQAADSNLSATLSADREKPLDFSDSSVFPDSPAAEESTRVASIVEAYTAAATAAFHSSPDPVPLAHPEFLAHQGFGSALEVLHARDGGPLSSEDISLLGGILQSCSSPNSKSHQQHDIAPKMEGRLFELHIIFGFNEFVSGPVHSKEKVGAYNPWTPDKYSHTHINFLAICKDRPYDPPTIFFAECGKDGADTCWCVPIIPQQPKSEQPRCVYCEHRANRIVHPATESFHGLDEFDKLFYESDRKFYTNNRAIEDCRLDIDWVHGVEDGAIYLNYCPDGDDGDEADWIQIS